MRVRELVSRVTGIVAVAGLDAEVVRIAFDSREVRPGDLFVAVRGEAHDGTGFIADAVRNGAVAVAAETGCAPGDGIAVLQVADSRRFLAEGTWVLCGDPAARMTLAGITGTNGKTTVAQLIDAIFAGSGRKSCVAGTLGYQWPGRKRATRHTTPEAPDLGEFLAESLASGCTHGALEISSHSLALKRVYGLKIAAGVFMNLTQDHLDFHRDMESYFRAKSLLFEPAGGNRVDAAVVNIDDPFGERLAAAVNVPCLRFGLNASAGVRLSAHTSLGARSRLRIETQSGPVELETPLLGKPNLYNIMAAAATAVALGISREAIAGGLESVRGVPGRMEFIETGQPFRAVVDYAHTPDALERLLDTARDLSPGRVLVVFGCGGDRDRTKRPVMGRIAASRSDVAIATSDNPRSEDPAAILAEIERGLAVGTAEYRIVPDRREAIRSAIRLAAPGDIVVVAGKGHEGYQVVGAAALPFDDRVVTRELIEESASTRAAGSAAAGREERQAAES